MNPMLAKLHDAGLNLQAVFNCDKLPSGIDQQMQLANFAPLSDCQLLLLGNGGTGFWRALRRSGQLLNQEDNPVDHYVIETIRDTLDPNQLIHIFYPGDHFTPLTQLGTRCGWHHVSPLGLGIHSEYGLWFAYRALALVQRQFEPSPLLPPSADLIAKEPSPCQRCVGKPCLAACPASAVKPDGFQLDLCAHHRLAPHSDCRATCHARSACPVGIRHQYSAEQTAYHYRHSLESIQKYQSTGGVRS